MRRLCLFATGITLIAALALAAQSTGPYKVLKSVKAGGNGGFDYVYADSAARQLYIPRGAVQGDSSSPARITVFNLDTLAPSGEIANTRANGVAVDAKSGHGFASSKPVTMWDIKTLKIIKTIDVEGGPDGILDDPYNERIYVFSHAVPHVTVIDAKEGTVLGTIDLGGAPEQAVSDEHGHIYADVSNMANVAVIDTNKMTVTAHYSLGDSGSQLAGLALDNKNHILFVACRQPQPGVMVMLNANDGKVLSTLPLAGSSDGAVFNPATMEAFSSSGAGNGVLTIIKEKSPTSFEVEQNLETMSGGKTLTFDSKTQHVYIIAAQYELAPNPCRQERLRGSWRCEAQWLRTLSQFL